MVRISHGKRAINVRVIDVLLYTRSLQTEDVNLLYTE